MNKIVLDNQMYVLDKSDISFDVYGESILYINFDKNINLKINLNEDSKITILDFNINAKDRKISVVQSSNTCLNYYNSFNNNSDFNFEYVSNIKGNNNINNVYLCGVNRGRSSIYVDAVVDKKVKNNELNESVKVLNLDGTTTVMPMLHISVLDIIANHNTVISNINENELFYLNSKGIDIDHASLLIENSYLYGLFIDYPEFMKFINGGENDE